MVRVDGERLWSRLMEIAQIGKTEKGGVCRVALTQEDKEGRDQFVAWCKHAGCTVSVDCIGNIFARRHGTCDDLAPVIMGSHLDSQPTGGRFDGVYGVIAGLEVIETLNDHEINTEAPLEVVCWTSEEGVRFSPAMFGSGVFSGTIRLEEALNVADKDDITVDEALDSIGYRGNVPVGNKPVKAAFELHIEQGPILEAENKVIGVVTGVQGIRWYDIEIKGKETHAGPTPMSLREDPVASVLPILQSLYDIGAKHAPWGRVTVGEIVTWPGSRNTVPGRLTCAVDMRHPDNEVLDAMDREFKSVVASLSETQTTATHIADVWHSPAVKFAEECIVSIRQAVSELGYTNMDMYSGAGHDSVNISRVAPTAMIFIPCKDGLSHNEAEYASPQDVTSGCDVLLHAVLNVINSPEQTSRHG